MSTAYLLAMFVAIPITGWAQSRLGGKRLWLVALTLFLVGSALCAFAWNIESLIAFRVVQGLGGGVMLPLMTTLLIQAAHGQNLGRLMAAVSLPGGARPDPRPGHRRPDPQLPRRGRGSSSSTSRSASSASSWPCGCCRPTAPPPGGSRSTWSGCC